VEATTVSKATQATDWRLGFTSMEEETAVDALPVQGALPDWLTGALVRVTPAKLEVGDRRLGHWFDGLAMLNRFGFADGKVSYRSRFLDTEAYRGARDGRQVGAGFGTDPCRTLFQRVQAIFSPDFTDNANVNLARVGERYIAMTETPLPIEFDPETLATIGPLDLDGRFGPHATTAHPHHDPERGELVNYVARFGPRCEYVIYGMPLGGTERRSIARMKVGQPAYMHAFSMSERHLILTEYPLRVNALRLASGRRPFIQNYRWDGGEPVRFQVFDRATGEHRGTYEHDAFFSFHHVNAFDRDGELVVDLCAYEDASIIDCLYLEGDGIRGGVPPSELRRYVVDLAGGGVRSEALTEGPLELPRIDYGRRNGRDYTTVYGAATEGDWFDALAKVDVTDGSRTSWRAEGCYPGEPVFVRRPGGEAEDDGVVLSVVLDAATRRSFLLILDAGTFEEIARAEAPHHIPYGFHGQHWG
jgi:beta,beta-carotene 9',10'-dioxygenase